MKKKKKVSKHRFKVGDWVVKIFEGDVNDRTWPVKIVEFAKGFKDQRQQIKVEGYWIGDDDYEEPFSIVGHSSDFVPAKMSDFECQLRSLEARRQRLNDFISEFEGITQAFHCQQKRRKKK